jgi:hypothetical protein
MKPSDEPKEWSDETLTVIPQGHLNRMLAMKPPQGTRLILASEDLLELFGTRAENGDRLSFEWGEPRPEGWYEPLITRHSDDNLVADQARQLLSAQERVAALEGALLRDAIRYAHDFPVPKSKLVTARQRLLEYIFQPDEFTEELISLVEAEAMTRAVTKHEPVPWNVGAEIACVCGYVVPADESYFDHLLGRPDSTGARE